MLGRGDNLKLGFRSMEWQVLYLSQVLLALLIYLQKELFYNSAMRQELAVMNLLWKKEQEQYRLSKENIALINHKCHDLKHQIRASTARAKRIWTNIWRRWRIRYGFMSQLSRRVMRC